MTKALIKDTLRSIARNRLRFLSVIVIVALGMSFYVRIKSASPAMKYEANEYFVRNNLMDVCVTSTIPFTDDDIKKIQNIKNVTQVSGSQYVDGYAILGQEALVNRNGTELTCRVGSLDVEKAKKFLEGENDPTYFNRLDLKSGRLPEKANECVVDQESEELYDDIAVGKTINIAYGDEGSELSLKNTKFTVVGIVNSPRYISADKGQTKLGTGNLDTYIYVLPTVFSSDEINELFVKMRYSDYLDSFSEEYSERAGKISEQIREVSASAIDAKLLDLKQEYTEKIEVKKSEISAYDESSNKELEEKQQSIKDFKEYVDNEDKILKDLKNTNEEQLNAAASTLSANEKSLSKLKSDYDAHVKSRDGQSSEIKGYSELKKLYDDLEKKHSAAKIELDNLNGAYQKKKSEFESNENEINRLNDMISKVENKISELSGDISSLESDIKLLNSTVSTKNSEIGRLNSQIESIENAIKEQNKILNSDVTDEEKVSAMVELSNLQSRRRTAKNELSTKTDELNSAQSKLSSAQSKKSQKESEKKEYESNLSKYKSSLQTAKSRGEVLRTECNNALSNYNSAKQSYDSDTATLNKYMTSMKELTKGQTSLTKLIEQVEKEKAELDRLEISTTQAQINYTLISRNSSVKINKAEYDLKVAKSRYGTVDDEYDELKNEITSKKVTLNGELRSLETTLGNLANLRWTATPRTEFGGIDSFRVSLENIKSMATVFPMIFFLTAMIACLVIMVKNVEEERKEIGMFKAFGYSGAAIVTKFMIYSLIAWAIGVFFGAVTGTCVLPFVICSIYNMTFSVPNVGTVFLPEYVFFGVGLSFIMVFLATLVAVINELRHDPATLMRPKNIAYNKRHFLEKFPSLWNRMSYGMVVVARTISRSRERVAVGTIGIACCTALILSSLGLINSTNAVSGSQYGDNAIFKYDIMFVLKTPQQSDTKILKRITADQRTESADLFSKKSVVASSENGDSKRTANVVSVENMDTLSQYVNFRPVSGSVDFGNGKAVVSDKMANDIGLSVGDKIQIQLTDGTVRYATVSGIVKNYTDHYIYMSAETYNSVFGSEPQYKYIIVKNKPYVDNREVKNFAADFLKESIVTGASTVTEMADSVDVSVDRIFAVVMMFVLSACMLALIVMYTNSNVNLSERTREIANIKVIGLSDHEVLIYVLRENLISTALGALLGLIAGIFLHKVLIGFISVDNVVYGSTISWWSYIVTVAIIVLISFVSSMPIKAKVNRINMAETLKDLE